LELLEDYTGIFNEHYNFREFIIEHVCDVEYLTRETLERYLDEIIDRIESMKTNLDRETEYGDSMLFEHETILYYFTLAILIFKTGSAFPDKVKEAVLKTKYEWVENLGGIEEFRQEVLEYAPGKPLFKDVSADQCSGYLE